MAPNHVSSLEKTFRGALLFAALLTTIALIPKASARVNVGFDVNIALPQGVHVNVSNYQPYYVGRVFYQPLAVWRPVYSFPVQTPHGVVYEPFVYDHGRVVCREYIPGASYGYGPLIVDGPGYYNPRWRQPACAARGAYHHDHGHRSHGWNPGRGGSRDRGGNWDRGRRGDDHSNSHGRKNGHRKHGR